MSILETISKCGYTDEELLEYIDEHFESMRNPKSVIVIFALTVNRERL